NSSEFAFGKNYVHCRNLLWLSSLSATSRACYTHHNPVLERFRCNRSSYERSMLRLYRHKLHELCGADCSVWALYIRYPRARKVWIQLGRKHRGWVDLVLITFDVNSSLKYRRSSLVESRDAVVLPDLLWILGWLNGCGV